MAQQFSISFSAEADRDILEATDWYIEQGAVRLALEWADSIHKHFMGLAQFPLRCPVVSEEYGVEMRQSLFGKKHGQYLIYFIVVGKVVHILHIHHSARDKAKI